LDEARVIDLLYLLHIYSLRVFSHLPSYHKILYLLSRLWHFCLFVSLTRCVLYFKRTIIISNRVQITNMQRLQNRTFVAARKPRCILSMLNSMQFLVFANRVRSILCVAVRKPQLSGLSNVSARTGERLRLVCRTRGNPLPLLHWYKDGARLHKSRDVKIRNKK
jgi:Immunoglobulin I-set domain